ncbi:MAG: glycosyltransferase family 39 protein, partial [Acidobacteria bacterium]|nr:glycosyltransferase family 39 protein [Acidobacteriota bacterium]
MRVARRFFSFFWLTLVVVMFCLPLFAGLGRSDLQNDEAIYSYAVDSILETGDWLNPRSSPNPDVVFLEKPPLKFWMVALPMRLGLLPHNEFGLRFWDAVFGSLAFLYVFAIGRRMAGPFCGFVAVLVLFSFHPLIFDHGLRANNMEAPLVLAYCGGVYHYLRWSELEGPRERRRHALAVGMWFFLGFMTKFVAAAFLPMI